VLSFVFRFITFHHFAINSRLYTSLVLYKQLISSLFEDLSNYLEMYQMYVWTVYLAKSIFVTCEQIRVSAPIRLPGYGITNQTTHVSAVKSAEK